MTQRRNRLAGTHASAFRRVTAIYSGYTRIGNEIARRREILTSEADDGRVAIEQVDLSLELIEALLFTQFETLEDALDDWRDLAPDEVAAIEARLRERLA